MVYSPQLHVGGASLPLGPRSCLVEGSEADGSVLSIYANRYGNMTPGMWTYTWGKVYVSARNTNTPLPPRLYYITAASVYF